MNKNIFIELFQFDAKMDYNGYYRKSKIEINENTRLLDVLNLLNKQEEFGYEANENFGLKANGYYTQAKVEVSDILEGDTLVIEPLSTRRVIKDLILDTTDFEEKLEVLAPYLNEDDKKSIFDTYLPIYYASNSLNYNADFIGDHVLLLMYDLIDQNDILIESLLPIIEDEDTGVWYHTSIEKRVFPFDSTIEDKIDSLFELCPGFIDRTSSSEDNFEIPSNIIQSFDQFKIALYGASDASNLRTTINNANASYIKYCASYNDIAMHTKEKNNTFVYKLAGEVLLDAYDNNADFVIIEDDSLLDIFDKEQKKIECAVGRDINLPIITTKQFGKLLEGQKDIKALGFDKHKVKIKFL